ncbi:cytochrome c oxidase subunit II [Granulosicoccus sp.]|nr:cytochrome c oxidase subunit II [Granulosicoccus sp.]MDB4222470.1 cytochrome c oxidase subunit II [Granulosicoccus sp.]
MTSNVSRWALLSLMLLLVPIGAWADWGALNMPQGVTDLSNEVYTLHMRIFYICCAIGVAVFAVMIYSMVVHRKSKGAKPATFHESTTVEIVWTVVPMIILIVMAIPAAKVLIKMEDFSDSEMSIKVTGYQWRWQYEYMDSGVSFYSQLEPTHNQARQMGSDVDLNATFAESAKDNGGEGGVYLKEVDNELVVPVGKKIRFLHTAADVIHSWWVPDLAVKKDAIPGFINENWALINEPGVYRGKCAELCGRDHGFMPVVVRAVSQEEFDIWIAEKQTAIASNAQKSEQQWSHEALVSAGQKVYQANCMSCHQAEGQGIPGMFPAIAGSDVATGGIDTHVKTVMDGVEGSMMTSFSQVLSNADIAAVITYQRNAFGNSTGDTLQPAHIKSLRDGIDISAPASVALLPDMNSTTGVN